MTTPAVPEGQTPEGEPTPQTPASPAPGTFTQSDIDKAAAAARRETSAKFSDYDDLKAQAAKGVELERQQLSDVERTSKDLATEQARTARLEGTIAETMINAAIQVKAAAMGIIDPEAALAMVDRSAITYTSADNQVAGVEEALDALLLTKTYLKGNATLTIPNLNATPKNPGVTPKPLTDVQNAVADRMGIPREEYAKQVPVTPGR